MKTAIQHFLSRWLNRPAGLQIAPILLVCCGSTLAFQPSTRPELPNFDKRAESAGAAARTEHRAAIAQLKEQVTDARVDFDERLDTPAWVTSTAGLLSGR